MNLKPIATLAAIVLLSAALMASDSPTTKSSGQKANAPKPGTTATSDVKGTAPMDKSDYLHIPFKTINGHDSTLAAFKGKVLLVVNTASECGYTPQYEGLEKLYEKYKDKGLVVVGFPANNFGGQEPGSNEQIAKFCSTKYSVTFPMMAKVSVKGEDKHPLFTYLTEQSPIPGEIKWNFSKFLFDKNGALIARYLSNVEPMDTLLTSKIESVF